MAKTKTSAKKTFSFSQMSSLIDKIGEESKIIIENDEETKFISTGVYVLNALLSKSILNGGVADDRFTIFAGPPATGKSYIMYNIARNAQKEGRYVLFIDTEHSVNKVVLQGFGIDTADDKLRLVTTNKVEDLKIFLSNYLDNLKNMKLDGYDLPKVTIFLDSIGQLASAKEIDDAKEGKNKADMTRAKAIKQLFRIINADMGYLGISMVASNHTYEDISAFFPQQIMAGGKGAEYTASSIVFLSTAKLKTGREDELDLNATGVVVTAQAKKNRFAKPKKVKFQIDNEYGTNPYIGLEFFCTPENFASVGIAKGKRKDNPDGTIGVEPGGTRWYIKHLDKTVFEKQLFTSSVFNSEVLNALEPIIYKYFEYSSFEEAKEFEINSDEITLEQDNDFDEIDSDSLFD
jgi:RecA/RadA recombinase